MDYFNEPVRVKCVPKHFAQMVVSLPAGKRDRNQAIFEVEDLALRPRLALAPPLSWHLLGEAAELMSEVARWGRGFC